MLKHSLIFINPRVKTNYNHWGSNQTPGSKYPSDRVTRTLPLSPRAQRMNFDTKFHIKFSFSDFWGTMIKFSATDLHWTRVLIYHIEFTFRSVFRKSFKMTIFRVHKRFDVRSLGRNPCKQSYIIANLGLLETLD